MGINPSDTSYFWYQCNFYKLFVTPFISPAYCYTLKGSHFRPVHQFSGFVVVWYYFCGFTKDTTDILLPQKKSKIHK